MRRVDNRGAREFIARREEFTNHTGSFRGVKGTGSTFGMLPHVFRGMKSLRNAEYTVFSYATPIAWVCRGRWYYADVNYSPTTSRHQSVVRWAMPSTARVLKTTPAKARGLRSYNGSSARIPASTGMPSGYYGFAV